MFECNSRFTKTNIVDFHYLIMLAFAKLKEENTFLFKLEKNVFSSNAKQHRWKNRNDILASVSYI